MLSKNSNQKDAIQLQNKLRDCNLEGCAYYELGEEEKAENKLQELKHTKNNVNNLAMMAIIFYGKGDYAKSQENIKILEQLSIEQPHSLIMAKAELAYAYTRLGARCYKQAIELFKEVISSEVEGITDDLKFFWKFGLALTYRRCTNASVISIHQDMVAEECLSKAKEYFDHIIAKAKNSKIKANAYIELAIAYSYEKCQLAEERREFILSLIEEGEKLDPNNFNLLAKMGQVFRIFRQYGKAKDFFIRSIKLKGTTYAHHHYGLLLRGKVYSMQGRYKKQTDHFSGGNLSSRPKTFSSEIKRNIKFDKDTSHKDIDWKSDSSEKRREEKIGKLTSQTRNMSLNPADDPSDISTDGVPCTSRIVRINEPKVQRITEINGPGETMRRPNINIQRALRTPIKHAASNIFTEKRILKSPTKAEIGRFHEKYTKELEECIYHFKMAVEISCETNYEAVYDLGLTYLQMSPPRLNEAISTFRKIIRGESSPFVRYRGFEQSGHCLMKMSENEEYGNTQENKTNAYEMYKKSIGCWALCQLSKLPLFDRPNEKLQSLCSIRDLILTDFNGKCEKMTLAELYYLIQEYRYSLGLYTELRNELERSGDSTSDFDITIGLINNHIEIGNFNDCLDLLNILLCSKDCNMAAIKEKLVRIIECSIKKEDSVTFSRVLEINHALTCPPSDDQSDEGLNVYDITIIYDESLQNKYYEEIYSCLGQIRGLKITRNDQDVPAYRFRMSGIASIFEQSCLVMFLFDDKSEGSNFLQQILETAVNTKIDSNARLYKIISVFTGDSTAPTWLKHKGEEMRYTETTDKQQWLCGVCKTLVNK